MGLGIPVTSIRHKRVTRILADFRTFEILLPGVFLWYANRIKIKDVIVRLCEPDDGFVPTRISAATMQPVLKVPNDAIPHPKTEIREDGVQDGIQRNDGASINVVSYLPANTALRGQGARALDDDPCLLLEVRIKLKPLLIFFADVIGRRCDNESECFVRYGLQEFKTVSPVYND